MTRLQALQSGRLDDPVPMTSFPFAHTIDLSDTTSDDEEPSPCLPTARSVWFALRPPSAGTLVVDLAGSTPIDHLTRPGCISLELDHGGNHTHRRHSSIGLRCRT